MADEHSVIVTTPDGDEFVVEAWKPSFWDGVGLLDSLALGLWSLLSPGWRINVKRMPVLGGKALHKERALSERAALNRLDAIAEALKHSGRLP